MNAPEKIYLPTRDGQSDSIWNGHWTHGKDVEYIRADIHEAEIDALKADLAASIAVREEMQLGGNRMAESLRFARADADALKAENAELTSALSVIHELAHNESTGPVFEDGYWAIRALAGEALGVK